MSVFTKYCDKLIFESVNKIKIDNQNSIQELKDSGFINLKNISNLKNLFESLAAENYILKHGSIETLDDNYNLKYLNPKSVTNGNLTFVSSSGKLFIESTSSIKGYAEKNESDENINICIMNENIQSNSFKINADKINKIELSFIKSKVK